MNNFITLKFDLISPIIITEAQGGDRNMVTTRGYINGSAIIGIFANKYIKQKGSDNDFYRLFIRGGLIFTDANCMIGDDKSDNVCYPIPLSIEKPKHAEFEESALTNIFSEDKSADSKTKPVGGLGKISNGNIEPVSVKKGINFHSAINNDKDDNDIFNYEFIRPFQTFVSKVIGDENSLGIIKELCGEANTFNARIGRSKSAQYGQVRIEASKIKNLRNDDRDDEDNYNGTVTITFISDVIVYNEMGFSTTDIKDLEKLLGVRIVNSVIRKGRYESFVNVWKAYRPSEITFLAGSTFLSERIPKNYKNLQTYGIGERTNEGLGRIRFDFDDNKTKFRIIGKRKNDRAEVVPPLPQLAKDIIGERIVEMIRDELIVEAFGDAEKSDVVSNSLISRLLDIAKHNYLSNHLFALDELRDIAKNNLKEAKDPKGDSLYDFLSTLYDKDDMIKKKIDTIFNNGTIGGFIKDNDLEDHFKINTILENNRLKGFKYLYLSNFLTQLKRMNKRGSE